MKSIVLKPGPITYPPGAAVVKLDLTGARSGTHVTAYVRCEQWVTAETGIGIDVYADTPDGLSLMEKVETGLLRYTPDGAGIRDKNNTLLYERVTVPPCLSYGASVRPYPCQGGRATTVQFGPTSSPLRLVAGGGGGSSGAGEGLATVEMPVLGSAGQATVAPPEIGTDQAQVEWQRGQWQVVHPGTGYLTLPTISVTWQDGTVTKFRHGDADNTVRFTLNAITPAIATLFLTATGAVARVALNRPCALPSTALPEHFLCPFQSLQPGLFENAVLQPGLFENAVLQPGLFENAVLQPVVKGTLLTGFNVLSPGAGYHSRLGGLTAPADLPVQLTFVFQPEDEGEEEVDEGAEEEQEGALVRFTGWAPSEGHWANVPVTIDSGVLHLPSHMAPLYPGMGVEFTPQIRPLRSGIRYTIATVQTASTGFHITLVEQDLTAITSSVASCSVRTSGATVLTVPEHAFPVGAPLYVLWEEEEGAGNGTEQSKHIVPATTHLRAPTPPLAPTLVTTPLLAPTPPRAPTLVTTPLLARTPTSLTVFLGANAAAAAGTVRGYCYQKTPRSGTPVWSSGDLLMLGAPPGVSGSDPGLSVANPIGYAPAAEGTEPGAVLTYLPALTQSTAPSPDAAVLLLVSDGTPAGAGPVWYSLARGSGGVLRITARTDAGLETVTTLPVAVGVDRVVIDQQVYPVDPTTLDWRFWNGEPLRTSGVYQIPAEVEMFEVVAVGGRGGGPNGGPGRRVTTVLANGPETAWEVGIGAPGWGTGPTYPGGDASYLYEVHGHAYRVIAGGGGGGVEGVEGIEGIEGIEGMEGMEGSPGDAGAGAPLPRETRPIKGLVNLRGGRPRRPGPLLCGSGGSGNGGGGGGGGAGGGAGGQQGECGCPGGSFPPEEVQSANAQDASSIQITFLPPVCVGQQGADKTVYLLQQPAAPGAPPLTFTVQRQAAHVKVISTDGVLRTTTTVLLPPASADCRTIVIETPDGEHHLFAVGPPICFQKGTGILTPHGYRPIETLRAGDSLCTRKGALVPVLTLVAFTELETVCPLYCLPKGALKMDCPRVNLYMSGNHAFRAAGKWRHMKCAPEAQRVVGPEGVGVEYFHIILAEYFEHTIYAEGVEVETCFQETVHFQEGRMGWICNADRCLPLKCLPVEF